MSGNGSNNFSNFDRDQETKDFTKTMNLPDGGNISQTPNSAVSVSAQLQHNEQQNSPGAPIGTDTTGQDLQTKYTPSNQHFANQFNMCARQVLPPSPQPGSQDNDRPRVHRDSLTNTQSSDGNDKHPDAMETSMRRSTVDDKWYGPLNSANNMNDVHMEDDEERKSESNNPSRSDKTMADARDYNAEGAKPKTEPGILDI
ncbi:Hypothetical predicted protein [Mytilus galloprovincialis]|uniref:Uncharacterized protein n=1 Tax=Mytilus galloprovincialis TaxID=29158 RepID=A0A8B6BHJ5_MYTGA|nr:Hypothetical predicted protein [Mytilus galloprovincialis]